MYITSDCSTEGVIIADVDLWVLKYSTTRQEPLYYNIFFLELSVSVPRKWLREGTATDRGAFVFDLPHDHRRV